MGARIGIDIGGTFTDLVVLDESGNVSRAKVLSTPRDYSEGIAQGLEAALAQARVDASRIAQLMHGTTIATNALLEGTGAKVALITTEGFRDVLEIRRLRMPVLYDIRFRKPPALVPRHLRFEVPERIDSHGRIERPLDEHAARAAIDRIVAAGVEAVAICLINGYANGVHEARLRELVFERAPHLPVSISSGLVPEIREYERTSTTVVNCYVLPLVRSYLQGLDRKLSVRNIGTKLTIMQSNGGAMSATAAAERPIHIIESGPAAGVVGAAELARRLGNASLLTFDMGGTTAKAALVESGRFMRVNAFEVGGGINIAGRLLAGGGYHVSAPAIDIAEVGAGGGSIARIDAGGALSVGPDSAGADPGPACYGRGGTAPTVTDANVMLGFIDPRALAGGGLPIRRDAAQAALDAHIARPLGLELRAAAWGVHQVANAAMARALRAVSTERGHDPRHLSMLAFGGNGPVHAATLARLLDIRRILVPPAPGVFSALGMLFPDIEHHYVRTHKRRLATLDAQALDDAFETLANAGRAALQDEGFEPSRHRFERLLDLRYVGANSELTLSAPASEEPDRVARLSEAFGAAHLRQYGYRSDEEAIEIVNARVIACASAHERVDRFSMAVARSSREPREVYFGPGFGVVPTRVVAREELDEWRAGPLLVDEFDSTTVVPPDGRARRVAWDTIEIELA
ncbi:MAG TPA: hydantoinase/oxoprolinase family protein [Casimicrobiaceae bacterium]|nr:hydantoinase/oxoprolinase family protein [Casimicrobiaceae bacterium]